MSTPLLNPAVISFSATSLPVVIVGLMTIALGLYVFVLERGSSIGRRYLFFAWSVGLYVFGAGVSYAVIPRSLSLLWDRIAHIGVAFIPTSLFLASSSLLGLSHRFRAAGHVLLTLSVFSAGLARVYRFLHRRKPRSLVGLLPGLWPVRHCFRWAIRHCVDRRVGHVRPKSENHKGYCPPEEAPRNDHRDLNRSSCIGRLSSGGGSPHLCIRLHSDFDFCIHYRLCPGSVSAGRHNSRTRGHLDSRHNAGCVGRNRQGWDNSRCQPSCEELAWARCRPPDEPATCHHSRTASTPVDQAERNGRRSGMVCLVCRDGRAAGMDRQYGDSSCR